MAIAALFALLAPAIALAAGTGTAGDPFTRLANAYKVTSAGRYWFNLGSGAFQADVDPAESGGWLLVLQYLHRGGTNPALAIKAAGAALPVTSTAALGTDESADATRWGHAGNAAMAQFTGDIELRWYGQTSAHTRIIHFRSTVGDAYVRTGTGDFAGINSGFTALTGHSAGLPAALNSLFSNQGNLALTEFPYYASGSRHWGIHGLGNRWEVDDYPNGPAYHTIHRVWVRDAVAISAANDNFTGAPINSASGGTTATVFANDVLYGDPPDATSATANITANGGITGLTITSAGQLVVPAGTAAGTYTPTYRICAVVSPTACATAIATIAVIASPPVSGTGCTGTNLATNGSFESPVVANPFIFGPTGVPGWSTNDTGIELWTNGANGVPSFAGNQFNEMNAFIANTVLTQTSGTIHGRAELRAFWAHRGRLGNDTASMVLRDNTGLQTSFGNFTDGSTAWGQRNTTLVAAPTATFARAVFSSVSNAGGGSGLGNLLDDVQLCQTYVTIGKALLSRTDVDSSGDDSVGDTLTYRFAIANPAGNNSALNAVTVTDNRIGAVTVNVPTSGDTNTNGFLDPGETWLADAAYTLTAADISAGAVTNSAFASGFTGANTIRSDDAVLTTPLTVLRLAIVKSADAPSLAGNVPAGHVVTYSYAVTNQGNVALTAITIADAHNGLGTPPLPGGETLTQDVAPTGDSTDAAQNGSWDTLGPGDTVTFTAGYTVTQNDVDQRQ